MENTKDVFKTQKHYDNKGGSLYYHSEKRGWPSYLFDVVKRVDRANKKGKFTEDIEKSKVVINMWIEEYNSNHHTEKVFSAISLLSLSELRGWNEYQFAIVRQIEIALNTPRLFKGLLEEAIETLDAWHTTMESLGKLESLNHDS